MYVPASLKSLLLSPLSIGRNISVVVNLLLPVLVTLVMIRRLSVTSIVLPLGSVQTTLADTDVSTTLGTVAVQLKL